METQSERAAKPLITGLLPSPYEDKMMGELIDPDLRIVIEPLNTSPLLNNITSPGCKLLKKEFSFFNVFHGVD